MFVTWTANLFSCLLEGKHTKRKRPITATQRQRKWSHKTLGDEKRKVCRFDPNTGPLSFRSITCWENLCSSVVVSAERKLIMHRAKQNSYGCNIWCGNTAPSGVMTLRSVSLSARRGKYIFFFRTKWKQRCPSQLHLCSACFLKHQLQPLQSSHFRSISHVWKSPDWCLRRCQQPLAENLQKREWCLVAHRALLYAKSKMTTLYFGTCSPGSGLTAASARSLLCSQRRPYAAFNIILLLTCARFLLSASFEQSFSNYLLIT